MRIVFLGTASSKPTTDRNVSSIALHYRGDIVLFDCGEGTQRQMVRRVKQSRISKICVTHFHGDHYLGIPGLLMTMSLNGRRRPLYIYGPPGTATFLSHLLHSGYMDVGFDVRVEEVYDTMIPCKGYSIRVFPVDHGVPAVGYAFIEDTRRGTFDRKKAHEFGIHGEMFAELEKKGEITVDGTKVTLQDVTGPPKKGKIVTYSGDTRPVSFPPETKGSSVLIHEATFISPEDRDGTYHSTVKEACEAARSMEAPLLVLTHLNSRYEPEQLQRAADEHCDDAVVAYDFLEIEI
ncbi:ribonuclease Z [archaeon]|nr:MAG: ribonuclease Z [archaeon]